MSKYNTVLFDLDGTLLDTLGDLTDGVNYVLSRFSFENRTLDEIRSYIGNGIPTLLRRALPVGSKDALHAESLILFSEYYRKNLMNNTFPYPGMQELVNRLCENGFKIGVVSNKKDDAVKELCAHFFEKIEVTLGAIGEDTRKPAPKLIFEAMEQLGSEKSKTIFVGDSDVDIMTANNAGIDVICVGWGYRDADFLRANGGSVVVKDALELWKLLTMEAECI